MRVEQKLSNGKVLIIRLAAENDAEEILSYLDLISGESDNLTFGKGEFGKTVTQEAEFLRTNGSSPNSIMILGIIDGEIVAVADIHGVKRPRISHYVELGISVKKSFWNLGIGRNILRSLIGWAKSHEVRKINLRVRDDNLPAIHLYKSVGFTEEGHISRVFYINSCFISCLEMGLEID